MHRLLRIASASALVLSSVLAQATEPTTWEKIKAFAHDRKAEAVAEGQKMIAATDRQIADLKKQIARSTGEARKAHEQNMAELQAKRKAAQAELNKMQGSAAATWEATKEGFSKAAKDLQAAYDKAVAGATSQ